MKYLFFVLVLITSCKDSYKRIPKKVIDYENYNLISEKFMGKPQSVEEYKCFSYIPENDGISVLNNNCVLDKTQLFDLKGNTITLILQDVGFEEGTSLHRNIEYDEKGFVVQSTVAFHKRDGQISSYNVSKYTRDSAGNKLEAQHIEDGILKGKELRQFDEYNCDTSFKYYSDGVITISVNSKYDNLNREIEENRIDILNGIESKKQTLYEYNKDDIEWSRKIERKDFSEEIEDRADLINKNIFQGGYHNRDGLPPNGYKDVQYYDDKKVKSWHYITFDGRDVYISYDRNQNIVEIKRMNGSSLESLEEWEYNYQGKVIRNSISRPSKTQNSFYKESTIFKLDPIGNWYEKYTIDSNRKVSDMRRRIIKYH